MLGLLLNFQVNLTYLSFLYSPSIQSPVRLLTLFFALIGLSLLKIRPRIKILVTGIRINKPNKSVTKPGIKRNKPPMGVKRVLRILSVVGEGDFFIGSYFKYLFKTLISQ